MPRTRTALAALCGIVLLSLSANAADLAKGTPDVKSVGPLTFGPEGLLFVGDTQGAAIFAIDTGDRGPAAETSAINVENLGEKVASMLGTTPREILINDLAVNPASGNAYLSVSRGRGPDAAPVIVKIAPGGKTSVVSLEDVKFAKAPLPNPPAANAKDERGGSPRNESITDLAFVDGRLFVAGLSNEEFSSRLLAIPYPFRETPDEGTSVEIYHGSHGRFETRSPVRTFVPYQDGGQSYLLSAYTCTPLVKLPVSDLKPGAHVKGTTIAELGNRNRPLDMVVYQQDGKNYLLMANSSRGVMKIPAEGVAEAKGIIQRVSDREGLGYQTVDSLKGVVQLDRLDKEHALVLTQDDSGALNLKTVKLP